MARFVNCAKLGKLLPGLEYAPMHGEMGERIYREVSEEAWKLWLQHSTMVINEFRLNPSEPAAQETLLKQMEEFFFSGGAELPPDYVAPKE